MRLIIFLYNLIYKAFTGDLSACNEKVVCSEVKEEIVQREIQEGIVEGIQEVGDYDEFFDGMCYEPLTGESKDNGKVISVTNYSLKSNLK